MNNSVILSVLCLAVACSAFPAEKILVKKEQIEVSSELKRKELSLKELEEAKSAKYHYSSDVDDGISDLTNQREEKRDGLKVEGFYAYSDGHVRRKVNYIADENGYRIANIEEEPLDGPQINPEGSAQVRTLAHGNEVTYSVYGDDKTRHLRNKSNIDE